MTSTRPGFKFHRSSFHERLREATRLLHRRLEAQLPLLDSDLTPARYRDVLRAFFGFYVPLESSLETSAPPALSADVACRRKSWWLLEDLLSLGDSTQVIGALPLCRELPPMATQTDVLGALYVVEGATLGGQYVLQSLRRSLGPNADHHVRFFASYGSRVPDMWAALLRILKAAAYDEMQEQAIIASACRTFSSFEQWLKHCQGEEGPSIGGDRRHIMSPRTIEDMLVLNAS
jgi:heme oxygenase